MAIGRPDGALVAADGSRLVSEPAHLLANDVAAATLEEQREVHQDRGLSNRTERGGAGFEM